MKKVFLFASLVSALSVSAQTVSKKIAFAKGQQLEQQSKTSINMTQEMMGQSMEIKIESSSTNLVEVKEESNAGFALTNTLKKVVMNMDAAGQQMNFDSDKKEDLDGQMGEAYRDKINKPREFSITKEGIVSNVKAEEKKGNGSDMIGGMLSGTEEVAGAPFFALANLPSKGAKVGDTWSDSASDKGSRTLNRYTLRQVSNGEGTVDINSDLNISRELEQQGMTMQMAMKGTSIGEYVFDVATGIVKSRKALTKASGNIDVMGQTIPITMESNTTSILTKK